MYEEETRKIDTLKKKAYAKIQRQLDKIEEMEGERDKNYRKANFMLPKIGLANPKAPHHSIVIDLEAFCISLDYCNCLRAARANLGNFDDVYGSSTASHSSPE